MSDCIIKRLLSSTCWPYRLVFVLALTAGVARAVADDPLPTWNNGASKQAIIDFVEKVTKHGSAEFVLPVERIAVLDNDGTLWVEQPMYAELAFAIDRVKQLASSHPEWTLTEPFKSLLAGDLKGAMADKKSVAALVMASHAGMTVDEFEQTVTKWLETARHPRFNEPYDACTYQPMVELIRYLRDNQFKTFIVSGGDVDFMRPWSDAIYGVPTEQVIGSCISTEYQVIDGRPSLIRLPQIDFIDDNAGKPVGIERFIGRRPILAFGNSDGDFEMLEWTTAGPGPRLGVLIHHTDAEREFAYDRDSQTGRLSRGLDEATQRGWVVVDMKNDWLKVFDFEK
jgi:hypothetical protein